MYFLHFFRYSHLTFYSRTSLISLTLSFSYLLRKLMCILYSSWSTFSSINNYDFVLMKRPFGVKLEMAKPWRYKLSSKSHWTFVLMKRQATWQASLGGPTFLVFYFFIFLGTPDSSRRIHLLGRGMIPYHCWIALWFLQASSLGWANCILLMFLIVNMLPWHFMAWAWG